MGNAFQQTFTMKKLLKFTVPTIIMMIFMSLYTIVDGIFVSRLIGTAALSAVNIIYPLLSVITAVSIMLATGGSASIAKMLGEEKRREAKEGFTLLVCLGVAFGVLVTLVCVIWLDPIVRMLGANDSIYHYCRDYALALAIFSPLAVLQMLFQHFFVTSGHPKLGLGMTLAGGIANIVLDYVFIGVFKWGIAGAAIATGIGFSIPAIAGLIFFSVKRDGLLCFVRPKWDLKLVLKSCGNGSSEMVTNFSSAIITYLFNIFMMRYLGEDGVAAITIVLYAEFVLVAAYLGYSSGIAPIISYNYGQKNEKQLKSLFKQSMWFIGVSTVCSYLIAIGTGRYVAAVFASRGSQVYTLAVRGIYIYSTCYLLKGVNILASSLFTAFSDGKVSAILSFMRSLVFIVAAMLILTRFFQADGVWMAVPVAEILAACMSVSYLWSRRKIYQYA